MVLANKLQDNDFLWGNQENARFHFEYKNKLCRIVNLNITELVDLSEDRLNIRSSNSIYCFLGDRLT